MIYLDEDAVKYQAQNCQQKGEKGDKYCSGCNRYQKKLCPLGEARKELNAVMGKQK